MDIQYCTLADRSRVAYSASGRGYPVVCLPASPFFRLSGDERLGQWPDLLRRLGPGRTLICYETRGGGLSDPSPRHPGLWSQVDELAAVVDAIGAEQVAIVAPLFFGPVGIAYAARYPDRVTHLALAFTFARGSDFFDHPRQRALQAISAHDPSLYFDVLSSELHGWSDPEQSRRVAEFLRDHVGVAGAGHIFRSVAGLDTAELLSDIRANTIVVHRRGLSVPPEQVARTLAREIPDARLALLDGASLLPFVGDVDSLVSVLDDFLPVRSVLRARDASSASHDVAARRLTKRELDAITLVAAGFANKEIARELGIQISTVKRHLYKTYRKLGARNRTEAAAIAREHSIIN